MALFLVRWLADPMARPRARPGAVRPPLRRAAPGEKSRGTTTGCTPTAYCLESPNTRGQMAVFLTRGFLTPW